MHLTRRSYVLVMLTAVIAIAGIWSSDGTLERVWRVPAALLLLGLAVDGLRVRHLQPRVRIATAVPAFLGRPQPGAFVFTNGAARALALEYAPLTPPGFEAAGAVRRVMLPPAAALEDAVTLLPVRLGPQPWPQLPARLRGPLALAWWNLTLQPHAACVVAPDTLRGPARARGLAAGVRVRRVVGAGQELYQLRAYARGDPADAHRLESQRAQRRARQPRLQRGSASRRAGRHRCRAPESRARRVARPPGRLQQRGRALCRDRHAQRRSHRARRVCRAGARLLPAGARTARGGGGARRRSRNCRYSRQSPTPWPPR